MLTVEDLKSYGANVDEGIARCAGKEELYLRLVQKVLDDEGFDTLAETILERDYDKAFDIVHRLKGAVSNLSLTPMTIPIERLTESLRAREERDYSQDVKALREAKRQLEQLVNTN